MCAGLGQAAGRTPPLLSAHPGNFCDKRWRGHSCGQPSLHYPAPLEGTKGLVLPSQLCPVCEW